VAVRERVADWVPVFEGDEVPVWLDDAVPV
jgi:hypothetical protein